MVELAQREEIEYGDSPSKVIEWFNARLEEGTSKVYVARGWCKRCGICVTFCPVKALDRDSDGVPVVFEDACISCGTCEIMCPDYAIVVSGLKAKQGK
ncbi:MAG: 4Fe-4S binding protein [Firmicutes bacterium]|nr:4Fe-4S binding protein [Bacillota bacterium]